MPSNRAIPPPVERTQTASAVAHPALSGCSKTADSGSAVGVGGATGAAEVVAAGDGGTLLRYDGAWRRLRSGVEADLRAAAHAAGTTWIVGDQGTVLRVRDGAVERVDLGTTCSLRAVFTRGTEVWFVGSEGARGAVWRRTDAGVERWGGC